MTTTPTRRQAFLARVRAISDERDQYGYVLILITLTLIVRAWAGDTAIGVFVSVVLGGITLAFILHTSNARRRVMRAVEFLVAASIILSGAALVLGSATNGQQIAGMFGLAIAIVAPFQIVRRIAKAPKITFRVVLGALAIYLLLGYIFSYIYGTVAWAQGGRFFVQIDNAPAFDYLYFSYVTMATVGYGDLTAADQLGKALAVTEALSGQLYLVSVVALIVGNLGYTRPAKPRPGEGTDDADEDVETAADEEAAPAEDGSVTDGGSPT